MGAFDVLGEFSDAQQISAAAASTNYIDLGLVATKLGVAIHQLAGKVWLCIRTAVAPTADGDTLSIELQCHEDSSFGAGTPATTEDYARAWMLLGGPAGAELTGNVDSRLKTAGEFIYRGTLPYECNERYIRLYYNNSTSTGVFTIDAWLQGESPQTDHGIQAIVSPVGNP